MSGLIGAKSDTAALIRMSSMMSSFMMILCGFSLVTSSSHRQLKISWVFDVKNRGTTPSGRTESINSNVCPMFAVTVSYFQLTECCSSDHSTKCGRMRSQHCGVFLINICLMQIKTDESGAA